MILHQKPNVSNVRNYCQNYWDIKYIYTKNSSSEVFCFLVVKVWFLDGKAGNMQNEKSRL